MARKINFWPTNSSISLFKMTEFDFVQRENKYIFYKNIIIKSISKYLGVKLKDESPGSAFAHGKNISVEILPRQVFNEYNISFIVEMNFYNFNSQQLNNIQNLALIEGLNFSIQIKYDCTLTESLKSPNFFGFKTLIIKEDTVEKSHSICFRQDRAEGSYLKKYFIECTDILKIDLKNIKYFLAKELKLDPKYLDFIDFDQDLESFKKTTPLISILRY
jgi:hypothetical protein